MQFNRQQLVKAVRQVSKLATCRTLPIMQCVSLTQYEVTATDLNHWLTINLTGIASGEEADNNTTYNRTAPEWRLLTPAKTLLKMLTQLDGDTVTIELLGQTSATVNGINVERLPHDDYPNHSHV